jgi:hypothetical protein
MVECQEWGRHFFMLDRPARCRSVAREKNDEMDVVGVAPLPPDELAALVSMAAGLSLLLRGCAVVSRRVPYCELRENTSMASDLYRGPRHKWEISHMLDFSLVLASGLFLSISV